MSRWLYTFAVVTTRAAHAAPRFASAEAAQRWLHGLVRDDPRQVAYYKAILDGWHGVGSLWEHAFEFAEPLEPAIQRVLTEGHCRVSAETLDGLAGPPAAMRRGHRPEVGEYVIREFREALSDWAASLQATRGTGVILAASLGPSMQDREFEEELPGDTERESP